MRPKFQLETIEKYVTEHPGCTCPEIIQNTRIPRCSVTSALFQLVRGQVLSREGRPKHYQYYKSDKVVIRNERGDPIPDHDLPNPLTAFINQRLREVRSV